MNDSRPAIWAIEEPKKFSHALRRLPKHIVTIYAEKIELMIYSKNPIGSGDKWENTRYGRVWVARLNEYYWFSYILDNHAKVIRLIRIGSHKEIGTEK